MGAKSIPRSKWQVLHFSFLHADNKAKAKNKYKIFVLRILLLYKIDRCPVLITSKIKKISSKWWSVDNTVQRAGRTIDLNTLRTNKIYLNRPPMPPLCLLSCFRSICRKSRSALYSSASCCGEMILRKWSLYLRLRSMAACW